MNSDAYATSAQRSISIDGVRRPSPSAPPQPIPIRRRTYSRPPQVVDKQRSRWQVMQLPLLLIAGALGGFFADTVVVGLGLTASYGIVAFVKRIPSRTTFTLALLLLGAISVMLLFKPSLPLMRNFSTYAFILLLVGAITLGRETRLPKPMRRKYRR